MKVKSYDPYYGVHCETTATGSLLKYIGIDLSEPMLFGIGEGLGYIFRNLYRDFLKESYSIVKKEKIIKSYELFIDIADMWKEVAMLFEKTSDTKDVKYINKASEILVCLSEKEKMAMTLLLT